MIRLIPSPILARQPANNLPLPRSLEPFALESAARSALRPPDAADACAPDPIAHKGATAHALGRTLGMMKETLRGMRAIDKQISASMADEDLDPRLRSEMQSVRAATTGATQALANLGIVVLEMINESFARDDARPDPGKGL